ncbi:MAG: hypothetical protein HY918_02295 [Candidatus Doudnabacteria bacterium]|nr:hypothetical protein [Candidatus Doudnabacteria bacterium]
MKDKPFVLSEDVEVLMGGWSMQRGFKLPPPAFYGDLLNAMNKLLENFFGTVVIAEEKIISGQINSWVQSCGLPAISMDGVYFKSPLTIQVTRSVDAKGKDVGLLPRYGALPLPEQVRQISESGIKEAVLVDDVVFSGEQAIFIIQKLLSAGVRVRKVLTGVSVGAGQKMLEEFKVENLAVYQVPEVIDEVCQRDFLPGVPRSGRTVVNAGNMGMPYILPFGNPHKWASIPIASQYKFSKECIAITMTLFEAVEKASGGKTVLCSDLGRMVFSLPHDKTRFVDALRRLL